jgi:hypothetical protein
MAHCIVCGARWGCEHGVSNKVEDDEPSSIPSSDLLSIYESFKHLDGVLRAAGESEDPFYRTASKLWAAICKACFWRKSDDVQRQRA